MKKALDSVHGERLWNTMGSYEIPRKMVRVEVGIYGEFECSVIDGFEISDWFKI